MDDPVDYLIRLRPRAGPVPAVLQLRHLLKRLGRCYELDCIEGAEIPREQPPGQLRHSGPGQSPEG